LHCPLTDSDAQRLEIEMAVLPRRLEIGRLAGAMAVVLLWLVCGTATAAAGGAVTAAAAPEAPMVIPVGPDGVTYEAPGGEDERWDGPTAMAIAPDGSVWIADLRGRRLVHRGADGSPLPPIDLESIGVWRISDLDVDADAVVALEINPAEDAYRVHRFSHAGELLASYDITEGYQLSSGLSGVRIAEDGAIVLELEGGVRLVQLVRGDGRAELVELDGFEQGGRLFATTYLDRGHAVVAAGDVEVHVTTDHLLGRVLFLGPAAEGGFYLLVEEVFLGEVIRVDLTVRRYRADGQLLGSARRDLRSQFIHVEHPIVVGPDRAVYMLDTAEDHVTVNRADFVADLPPVLPPPPVVRVAGADRFATAAAVSRRLWAAPTSTAVVATGQHFADALAAGAVAARHDAPLLLDGPGLLDELARLGVGEVIVAGGAAAIPESTVSAIRALPSGPMVRRFAGPDRFATAAALVREAGAPDGAAAVASGVGFADAVSAGALLATPARPPVVLTLPDALPAGTEEALTTLGVRSVWVLGGAAVVGDEVPDVLADRGVDIARLAGTGRYDTSLAVLDAALAALPDAPRPLVVATGGSFPDALAAGAAVAKLQGTLLLVPRDGLTDAQQHYLATNRERFSQAVLVGGVAALSETVEQQMRALFE
jgi:putative cell wall-binding protein